MTIKRPVFIVAGGTGGHVFPAVALAEELVGRGEEVHFFCDARGQKYLPQTLPARVHKLPLLLYRNNSLFKKVFFFASLLLSSLTSWGQMILKRPKVVIGFGGYPTFAGILAAHFSFRPLFLHEQNAHVGQTNRLFTRFARKLILSTPQVRGLPERWRCKTSFAGMPVRPLIETIQEKPYTPSQKDAPFSLLVLGGSQGAKVLAERLVEALVLLPKALQKRIYLTLQCRAEDEIALRKKLFSFIGHAVLQPFFENVPELLQKAHLVISRAGASSLAEIATSRRPAIFIPYPHAKDDHQTANAELCAKQGGGWLFQEKDLLPEPLADTLIRLMNHPEALLYASEQILRLSSKGAAKKIAELILESAEK